ncbi:protein of unknown function [Modestobacter italicus]|uniref:Uncharacterized protein n=1 Tax=Modestobacter italicus (strain DSM 44449 / CECT 9708 / BC 501) TaxID=2732864 RepID=I4ES86_MODI5|nr:protein of unknown function [Modestobacter marinus]
MVRRLTTTYAGRPTQTIGADTQKAPGRAPP